MKNLILTAKPVQSFTFVFGYALEETTRDQLIELAKTISSAIKTAKETNKELESSKISQQIEDLTSSMKEIVELVDSDYEFIEKSNKEPVFNLELPAIDKQNKVFGVWEDELTEEMIKTALTRLVGNIKELEDLNKDLESNKIKKQIAELRENKISLVKLLDNLETEA